MSISSEITRISNAKTAITSSITSKGVTVPSGTTLSGLSAYIDDIETYENLYFYPTAFKCTTTVAASTRASCALNVSLAGYTLAGVYTASLSSQYVCFQRGSDSAHAISVNSASDQIAFNLYNYRTSSVSITATFYCAYLPEA